MQYSHTAQKLPDDKPVLMIVDMDAHYLKQYRELRDFSKAVRNFTEKVREHYSVLHIWDDHDDVSDRMYKALFHTRSKPTPIETPRQYKRFFPGSKLHKDDWIMGKKQHSAFEGTKLGDVLPKNQDILVTGLYGKVCVPATIGHGLALGFNMCAVEDLIYYGPSLSRQSDYNEDVKEYDAQDLLNTL